MSSNYTPLGRILTSGSLGKLAAHCQELQELERQVLALLPENLATQARLCNISSTALVLSTHSSAWAARLRMMAPRYLPQIRAIEGLQHVRAIRIRTLPDSNPASSQPASATRPRPQLSNQTRELLLALAEDDTDPELSDRYRRLAGVRE